MRSGSSVRSKGWRTGAFRVGTSGFGCDARRGVFYPRDLKSKDMLRRYAGRFSSVEIDCTFRTIPLGEDRRGVGRRRARGLRRTTDRPPAHLARWVKRIGAALGAGRDVYCRFLHEDTGRGTEFAAKLNALLR